MSLHDYGWNDSFSACFESGRRDGEQPARVTRVGSGTYRLVTPAGPCSAVAAGRLGHAAAAGADLPTVGDWVAASLVDTGNVRIERVLERRSVLSRKVAGRRAEEQVVAANVDTVVVVMGLDGDFNLRRLERFLTTVWASGAQPLVLLNKTDLCDDPAGLRASAEQVASGAPVLQASCREGTGVEAVRERIAPGETAVLVGSSGVGKSTLINRLLDEEVQRTVEVRAHDDRGRHATTHRELFRLPSGGMLIDSPGIRELQIWGEQQSLARAFEDVTTLGDACQFRDCTHETETGCAVLEAVERGSLPAGRLTGYRELQRELRYLERRRDESAQRIEKNKWRAIHREMRRSGKHRRR